MDVQLAHRSVDQPLAPEFAGARNHFGVIPGLVWAFRIRDDGVSEPLPVGEPIEGHHEGWLWLHLDLSNTQAAHWLSHADLPPAAVATMLSRDRHQQLHATDSFIYGIFADLVRRIDKVTDEVGHLRFIMTDRLLISGRHHALASAESARIAIETGRCKLPHVAALLEMIVEHVADGIDQISDNLANELDRIENILAERAAGFEQKTLTTVRRTSVRLHRQLSGLRAVFHRLERQGTDNLPRELRVGASKLAQRLDDLDHGILEVRERGHRLQEEVSFMMGEQTNRHLYILSVLTTLILPPTLITGIFGMNTKGLPLTDVETGFLWAMALVAGSSAAVYLLMRQIGVFKL